MCGIAAIFAYHPDAPGANDSELTAIRDHMKVRGPDGAGNWFDSQHRIALGHRRLSIIDLSDAGAQPMHWPERKLTIVFNGEIYNYRELRRALEQTGHQFKSTSDTEVLLHLYAEHGAAMLTQLRGMFAFALWDGNRRGLLLARDPFGIKPLYLSDDGKTLRAASQVKALLAGGKISISPEPAGHVGFFLWGHVPEPFTLYREIRALTPGTTLWVDAHGNRQQETFCSVTKLFVSQVLGLRSQVSDFSSPTSHNSQRSALSASLCDSVAHHLVADVPVGVFLSSGLDSTTLAALAAEQGGNLRTVTLGFEEFRGTANDETPLAESVARQYHAQHQTIWVTRQDFQTERERLLDAMDQPTIDGVNTYFVSLAARRAGLKVALSGLGGDELFGGYPSFTEIPRSVSTFQLFLHPSLQPLARGFRVLSTPVLKRFTSSKYAGLLEYGGTYGGAYWLRRGLFMPWELPEFLDRDFVREGLTRLNTLTALNQTADLGEVEKAEIAKAEKLKSDVSVSASQVSDFPNRLRIGALELTWYMRNQLLRDADWAGMAHSLEIRVPLVDIQLLRSLLPALASANPPTKRDMALSPGSQLPTSVLLRKKTGFSVPVRDWLLDGARNAERGTRNLENRGLRGWAQQVYGRFTSN